MSSPVFDRLSAALADRYRLERELGQGGMATVYLAHDLRHERRVALKVMRPELAAVIGAERFLQEIKTTANLQHPHILALFDSGKVDGTVFYVMPFVEGESLRDRLHREKQLPIDQAIRITREVAGALDYAHRKGVIHRDIKPENILLHDGQVLVADFGIALAASAAGGSRLTETGLSLGTPAYMSPEQATGERTLDARTDIYALGCVLYEALAGEPPFTGPTAQSIVAKVLTSEPPRLRESRKTVPPGVEAVVFRALQKLPADRFGSAGEFAAALQDGMTGGREDGRLSREHAPVFPSSRLPVVVLALAAGLLLGATAVWLLAGRSQPSETREPRHLAIALPDSLPFVAGRDAFGVALGSLDLSRDGHALVYVAETAAGPRLVLVRLDNGTVAPLPNTEQARSPVFSPDGRAIAFVWADSMVRRLSLDDGRVSEVGRAIGSSMRWHEDGRLFYDGACQAAPVGGGKSTRLAAIACLSNWVTSEGAFIDPASEWMLLQAQGTIQLVSRLTGAVRPLLVPGAESDSAGRVFGHSPRFVAPGYLVFVRGSTLFAAPFDAGALRLTGAPQQVLTNVRREQSGQAQIAVSGDGVFVWAGGGDESLARFVWVTQDGRVQDTLAMPAAEVGSYALSPDGKRLAWSAVRPDRSAQLMVADLERGVVERASYPHRLDPLSWVQGGKVLSALLSHADLSGRGALVRFDGSAISVDTTLGRLQNESPNGALRCLESADILRAAFGPNLFVHGTSGADSVRVDEAGAFCRFSPDSRFVAWGTWDGVFVASSSAGGRGSVLVGPAGGSEPRWSSDGRQIVYRAGSSWYAAPAPTTDLKPAGRPRLLFRGGFLQALASWELGRDGRLLLLQGERPLLTTRLNVITDFPRFLAQKLAAAGGAPRLAR